MTSGRVALSLCAAVWLWLAGCASTGGSSPLTAPVQPGSGDGSAEGRVGTAPWQVPEAELDSQRLFRLRYDGPEGEVGLKMTLWLASPERYRLSASDVVGRRVWTLSIEGEEGLFVDHRNSLYCRLTGAIDLEAVPLSPFRFAALPAILLGRLPEIPAAAPSSTGEGAFEMIDATGARWTYRTDSGRVIAWTLWQAGEPAAWWTGRGEEVILSQRRDGKQIRWRQVVREALGSMPDSSEIPAEYREECAEGD